MVRPFVTLNKLTLLMCYFKNIGVKTPFIFPPPSLSACGAHPFSVHCSNSPLVWSGSLLGKTLFHEMFEDVMLDSLLIHIQPTGPFKYGIKRNTLHSTPSTPAYHRAVSSDPYSTHTRQTCQRLNIR